MSGFFFIFSVTMSIFSGPSIEQSISCDDSGNSKLKEGNLGDVATFPWLGVLRVHLHEGDTFKIALTGLVLIKKYYAIANADDVVRIPKHIFKEDSKAMFIPADGAPWYCQLEDYMVHPEYEWSTLNTIVLIELALNDGENYPLRPVCWPQYHQNASYHLYALGFTDENKLLEKIVYKIQYVEKSLCDEFYNRAGLKSGNLLPTHYQCGFAMNNTRNCVWDNGMALVSNSTGRWTLIGFGIRGPGCAAPARFIEISPYLPWIETSVSLNAYDHDARRKYSAGFRTKPKGDTSTDVPIHALFQTVNQYGFPDNYVNTINFPVPSSNMSRGTLL